MEIAEITKQRIKAHLAKGMRFDGRTPMQYRPITIETGVSKKAEGSAKVRIGETEVWAGVKLGTSIPFGDSPKSGTLMVTAEFSPMASEKFERGPPSIESIELARIVDRGIRESDLIDLDKLCIKEGEKVWCVFVDIYPINDAGNLADAAALAAIVAIKTAVFPEYKNDKINFGVFTDKHLPLGEYVPFTMTFHKIGDQLIVDPTVQEGEASEAHLTISVSSSKKGEFVHAMQKAKDITMSVEEVNSIIDHAVKEFKVIQKAFEDATK
ncbi:MAG: exosome complex protein Rrp42 [Nanoarchaeota archaeon]|nr:exosome complex protein Rrp42 [Nanoarchaeota archaeon]